MSDASTTTTQQSIANQIFKVVFAFYFLVTMMVTTILMLTDYRTAEKQVREELDLLYGAAQAGIVDSLRRSDNKQLRFFLDEVVQHPSLLGIKIVAPDGRILAGAGILVNAKEQSVTVNLQGQEVLVGRVMGMFAQTHKIVYQTGEGKARQLGEARLYSNTKIVFQNVRLRFILLVTGALLKTAALWLIFYWVMQFRISRPLSLFTYAMNHLELENPEEVKVDLQLQVRNELKALEGAYNGMIDKLTQLSRKTKV